MFGIDPPGYRPPPTGLFGLGALPVETNYAARLGDAAAPWLGISEMPTLPAPIPTPAPSPPVVQATGWSGRRYTFRVHRLGDRLPAVPGIYIFSMLLPDGHWYAIYVGESDDLSDRVFGRLWSHEKCVPALVIGATHLAVTATSMADKANIEIDLIRGLEPPLNLQ